MASMRVFQQLVILLLLGNTHADFAFTNPPNTPVGGQHFLPGWAIDNELYQIGTIFNVTWSTDWTAYTIFLSQLQIKGLSGYSGSFTNTVVYVKNESDAEPGGTNWTVDIGSFSVAASNIFFFTAGSTTASDPNEYGLFNVTEDAVTTTKSTSATSSISGAATATNSGSSTAAAVIAAITTAATGDSETKSSSSASNKSLEMGLGIGLGAALLLVASLAGALLFKLSQAKKRNDEPRDDRYLQLETPHPSMNELNGFDSHRRELDASPVPARELPG